MTNPNPRLNPRFARAAEAPALAPPPPVEVLPLRPATRPRPNTSLILGGRPVADREDQEPIAETGPLDETLEGQGGPLGEEPVAPTQPRRDRSASSVAAALARLMGDAAPSDEGSVKFTVIFPPAVWRPLVAAAQAAKLKPGGLVREVVLAGLADPSMDLARVREAAGLVTTARRRGANPSRVTKSVTLVLPAAQQEAVAVACRRTGLEAPALFEGLVLLHVIGLGNED